MTVTNGRHAPPTAREVERRLTHPAVMVTRPIIAGSIRVLGAARPYRFTGAGTQHVRSVRSPVILAANHQSHVDTPAILSTLYRPVRERVVVAAALDVFGNGGVPSLKREWLQLLVAAGFNAFGFDRHGPPLRSLRTATELVRNGWSILLYPEGTRSRTGRIGTFKAGVSVLARFTGRPVIPVHVGGGRQVLPCGAFFPRSGRVHVTYGPPLRFGAGNTLAGFAARVERRVRELGADRG